MSEEIYFEESSGNVFADIGVREPEDAALRADLAKKITDIINSRGLSQIKVARILGVDQPKVSKLVHGRIAGFTSDRLFRFLSALGCDVKIEVKAKKAGKRRGKVVVVAA
ncbi:MAG: helix-turn-helix domain-containing protein [Candidatus Binataceae bacterium]